MTNKPIDTMQNLIGRLLHCQKMVDAGVEDWSEYGDELIKIRTELIPAAHAAHIQAARIDELEKLSNKANNDSSFDFHSSSEWFGYLNDRISELQGDKE